MFRQFSSAVCLSCALFPAGGTMSLCAQNRLDSLQRLDEVVVTAKTLSKEVIPVQQLAGAQLQRLGAHSVADAIRYFSGVQIKDYGGVGGLKTVNIRSMGTNHVGVFYDGIELGNHGSGDTLQRTEECPSSTSQRLCLGRKYLFAVSDAPICSRRASAREVHLQDRLLWGSQPFHRVGQAFERAYQFFGKRGIYVHHRAI